MAFLDVPFYYFFLSLSINSLTFFANYSWRICVHLTPPTIWVYLASFCLKVIYINTLGRIVQSVITGSSSRMTGMAPNHSLPRLPKNLFGGQAPGEGNYIWGVHKKDETGCGYWIGSVLFDWEECRGF